MVRAVFARTMFKPTYGSFGCACCANETHFHHYNGLLRRLGRAGGGGADGGSAGARPAACAPNRIHALDLQWMMHCNDSVGSCSSRTGWTTDGLHPNRAVLLQYLGLTFHAAADLADVCAPPATARSA